MRSDLPSGTVTFLFTDVEGSTRLLHTLGAEPYAAALAEHRQLIREACARRGGVEVDTQGDAFFFAFASAQGALVAASEMTSALASGPIRVRVGLHTGTPHLSSEGYVGADVHFAARVAASGHGGQVVLSAATASLLDPSDTVSQGLPLTALGSHRLKDIEEAVSLFQLGEGAFPPLKTIANSNLPTPASSFLGREAELFEADELLKCTRLLTVTGPGGAGKTRFSLELARRAREERFSDYPDGVFSCFLSSLRDPTLVLTTLCQTLSVREQPGLSALDSLSLQLADKKLLLLIDNLEHLLVCAPELSRLLSACPHLTLLCTSRELLRLSGEHPYALPPLAEAEGVALFCERARTEPTDPIRALCQRLEGLPLALELAAARMGLLSPEQLLERLSGRLDLLKGGRDADPRQQTLRATIEWSYDLLSPAEQELFRRLSVFQGSWTLEAAEEVADADLDTLEGLLDKSLLRRRDTELGPRFWMLETIREYAHERLESSREAEAVRTRHAERYTALAEQAEPHTHGPEGAVWLDRLAREHDNFRAALAWQRDSGEREFELRLAGALCDYWQIHGYMSEGWIWLEHALAVAGEQPALLRAKALRGAGLLASRQGRSEQAEQLLQEGCDLSSEFEDRELSLGLLCTLAGVVSDTDDDRAASLYKEAERLASETGGEMPSGLLVHLADFALRRGDYAEAERLSRESLAGLRSSGDAWGMTFALANLSLACIGQGREPEARAPLAESLRLSESLRATEGIAIMLSLFAAVTASEGDPERAVRLLAKAEALLEEIEVQLAGAERAFHERTLTTVRSQLDEERAQTAWDEGRAMDLEEAIASALGSPGLASRGD